MVGGVLAIATTGDQKQATPCALLGGEDASWCTALRCAVLLPVGVAALSCA